MAVAGDDCGPASASQKRMRRNENEFDQRRQGLTDRMEKLLVISTHGSSATVGDTRKSHINILCQWSCCCAITQLCEQKYDFDNSCRTCQIDQFADENAAQQRPAIGG